MKLTRVIIDAFDDIEYAATKKRIPAETTVRLAFDGEEVELDLTEVHKKHIRELLDPYLEIGRPVKNKRAYTKNMSESTRKGWKSRARFKAMRDFSDANIAEHPSWSYKVDGSGSWYYTRDLREAFAEYEASQVAQDRSAELRCQSGNVLHRSGVFRRWQHRHASLGVFQCPCGQTGN